MLLEPSGILTPVGHQPNDEAEIKLRAKPFKSMLNILFTIFGDKCLAVFLHCISQKSLWQSYSVHGTLA